MIILEILTVEIREWVVKDGCAVKIFHAYKRITTLLPYDNWEKFHFYIACNAEVL